MSPHIFVGNDGIFFLMPTWDGAQAQGLSDMLYKPREDKDLGGEDTAFETAKEPDGGKQLRNREWTIEHVRVRSPILV